MQQAVRQADAIQSRPNADPVTLDIIRGKLVATADEMGVVVARTSMSPVIYEVLDYACGITDHSGNVISQTNGITVFTGTFAGHVHNVIDKFADRMKPGDIYMANDPYRGGTHLSDVAIIKPVFVEGEILAFGITVAHWTDIGGMTPGSMPIDGTEILHEGLRFTGLKIYREGERADDLVDLIVANTRLPKNALGDLNASLAAVRIVDTRLQEICAKYGVDQATKAFNHILTTSEILSRRAIQALPDGTYEAQDFIDGDGVSDVQFPVQVKVTIDGNNIQFDFTGTCDQVPGPVNCARGALSSAVKTAFKALVGPHDRGNEGWFRPVEIVVPDGTVFSAMPPTPVSWYFEAACFASELIWKALAPIAPDRYSAGSYLSLCATVIAGSEPRTGDPFVLIEPHMGGWGAADGQDGTSALVGLMDGDTYNYSVELLEAKFPLLCRRYALNTGDGTGAGRYRGGFGTVRDYEMLANDSITYVSMGRSIERPWGLVGGGKGTTNYVQIHTGGESQRGARVPSTAMKEGEVISIVTGGGGGYGDPFERPVDEVVADTIDGYITPECARSEYGVVMDGEGQVDTAASQLLRQKV